MVLTSSEKKVLVRLMIEIIISDGIISDNEKAFMGSIQKEYAISQNEFSIGQKENPFSAISYLTNMEDRKKAQFCRIFQKLGQIDGTPFKCTTDTVNEIIIKARLLDAVKRCGI